MAYTVTANEGSNTSADVKRVDLSALRKQKILIDLGDDKDHILYLNLNDMGIISRISEGYEKLRAMESKTQLLVDDDSEILDNDTTEVAQQKLQIFSDKMKAIDSDMRDVVDFIFDSNVCEVCDNGGFMYDPIGGKLRYEHIIDALMGLYSDSISKEMNKVTARVKKHTAKYTGKK